MEDDPEDALAALGGAPTSAAILRRRAELFFGLGRDIDGRDALVASLKIAENTEVRALAARLLRLAGENDRALELCDAETNSENDEFLLRRERVATLAALGRYDLAIVEMADGAVFRQAELAVAAVGAAGDVLLLAGAKEAGPDLLLAASSAEGVELVERITLLKRATGQRPKSVALWSALAEVEELAGNLPASIEAWDTAAPMAAGAERPVLAPIRMLRTLGNEKASLQRADAIAVLARSENNSDGLRLASLAYRYAGAVGKSVVLAREALALRAGEGRLESELAHRLEEAGERDEAAVVLAKLLACGSRGRPWHRHELVGRLEALVGAEKVRLALGTAGCDVVDGDGLEELLK